MVRWTDCVTVRMEARIHYDVFHHSLIARSAQLLADAAAQGRGIKTKIIGHEEAKFSHDKLVDENIRWMFFQPAYEELLEETGGKFLA